jgi:VIT1/CCC1 family predicted Fe2+/Mn2+ transporter
VLSTWTTQPPARVLDPLERTSEILFGVIMVLTFTSSISVAESGQAETREVLIAALGCNVAWGIVDAAFYLMATVIGRARGIRILHTIRENRDHELSQRLILGALPEPVSAVLVPPEVEELRIRLARQPEPQAKAILTGRDISGAIGVFLLVFLSTLPISLPFLLFADIGVAMRVSNAVAIAMLFGMGWTLGTHTGRSGWSAGLAMVCLGLVLVAITIALGG